MAKDPSRSGGATPGPTPIVWEVEIECQPPLGSPSTTPVRVAVLKLKVGLEADVGGKRLYLSLSREKLLYLAQQISNRLGKIE